MHKNFGSAITRNRISTRQCGNRLKFTEGSLSCIVIESSDVTGHLVIHVSTFPIGTEREVARTAAQVNAAAIASGSVPSIVIPGMP